MKYTLAKLILLIQLISVVGCLSGIWFFYSYFSDSIRTKRVQEVYNQALRLSSTDMTVSFSRALQIYQSDEPFSLFDQNCDPIYVNDLVISKGSCNLQDRRFWWGSFKSADDKLIYVGSSEIPDINSFVVRYREILILIILSISIFALLITLAVFYIFIHIPLTEISAEIKKHELRSPLSELRPVRSLLSDLHKQIHILLQRMAYLKIQEEKLLISKQISHDLAAPLSILIPSDRSNTNLTTQQQKAIKRIRDISLKLLKGNLGTEKRLLNPLECAMELKDLYGDKLFIDTDLEQDILLRVPEVEVFRVLSNIIKNSTEANSNKIYISLKRSPFFLKINLRDDGSGISTENLKRITQGFSTKEDGNGIGLISVKNIVQKAGGTFSLSSILGVGTTVEIDLPIVTHVVLIDDDRLIRTNWLMRGKAYELNIHCFKSIDDFLINSVDIPKTSSIFVDVDLGTNVRGDLDSKRIYDLGFNLITLATGYSESEIDLTKMPWIRDVISKTPPF